MRNQISQFSCSKREEVQVDGCKKVDIRKKNHQLIITMTSSSSKQRLSASRLVPLMLLLFLVQASRCNSQQNQTETRLEDPVSETSVKNDTLEATTNAPVLLSGNEFVDFTESPTLLFDGTASEPSNETTKVPNVITTQGTTVQPVANNSSQVAVESGPKVQNDSNTTTAAEQVAPITTTTEEPNATTLVKEDDYADEGANLSNNNQANGQKPSFEPPKNVSQYMDYIERLFHDLRHQITDLFEPHIPQLIRTSQMVQLSGSCSYDMLRMALALRQFEPWALRMIDSSGKVPEGIFEGSFTALGSYDECLTTVFSGASGSVSSTQATQGKYCLVNVSPYMPPKPPADRVELMFQEEANRRNYTKDDQFSRLSPMFYYMKFRIGVCIPSTCEDSDMESISSALSSSLRLNITIPHCRVKHDPPITRHQLVGGLVFGLVLTGVICATLMDYWKTKLERLDRKDNLFVFETVSGDCNEQQQQKQQVVTTEKSMANVLEVINSSTKAVGLPAVIIENCGDLLQAKANGRGRSDSTLSLSSSSSSSSRVERFQRRVSKHWAWISFSFLTNYKLHFLHKKPPPPIISHEAEQKRQPSQATGGHLAAEENDTPIVRCLNGIRVISLCWVIVANSYITLDPRATKRLAKTREAPKDFLFQLVAQASLAIETFFFLSGCLLSLSFARKLNHQRRASSSSDQVDRKSAAGHWLHWIHFYLHRYIRMTPATMLVIAFTMFAFRFGDGPLWFEATHKAHMSCSENWWRHLLHVANFIDTRQMCFIHYWYIAADMQLFLFAPILMFLIYQRKRIGYAVATLIGLCSVGFVFYTTYIRNLPPTLLFYNSDPESRREFGNTIMTKPLTHALPYLVGMLVGKWLVSAQQTGRTALLFAPFVGGGQLRGGNRSLATLLGSVAALVLLGEIFLPYKWNNSHLPTRFMGALYAALFRFLWSLVLAYLVISCAHRPGRRCRRRQQQPQCSSCLQLPADQKASGTEKSTHKPPTANDAELRGARSRIAQQQPALCFCGSGGSLVNRLLSLNIFAHLSKLSFVAYLIHLPLMSVFISQTRGLFAFSHTLVIHLALSYLVMTFILSFVLVHVIEFPFVTFERYLFERLLYKGRKNNKPQQSGTDGKVVDGTTTDRKSKLGVEFESAADRRIDNHSTSRRRDDGDSEINNRLANRRSSAGANSKNNNQVSGGLGMEQQISYRIVDGQRGTNSNSYNSTGSVDVRL